MFTVTIKRTITTTVGVSNANSAADARRIVKEYGIIEAVSDLPVISETLEAKISRVDEA